MKRQGIRYKDVTATPGSTLHQLLEDALSEKDTKKQKELRTKAEACYTTCESNYRKQTGE